MRPCTQSPNSRAHGWPNVRLGREFRAGPRGQPTARSPRLLVGSAVPAQALLQGLGSSGLSSQGVAHSSVSGEGGTTRYDIPEAEVHGRRSDLPQERTTYHLAGYEDRSAFRHRPRHSCEFQPPWLRIINLFSVMLQWIRYGFQVTRESKTGGVPGGVSTALAMGGSGVPNVPIIVWRCVEEVERRGLDIIGKQNIWPRLKNRWITAFSLPWNSRLVQTLRLGDKKAYTERGFREKREVGWSVVG